MDVVADFIAITECGSEDVAVHYLSTTDFNLHEAVALYNEEKAATVAAERAATQDATTATSSPPPPTGATTTTTTTANVTSSLTSSSAAATTTTTATAGGHVVVDTLGTTHALPTATHGDNQAYYARNPFENSSNPALREMYTTPSYVQAFAQPLTALCERAAQRDRWVLLAIRDGSFACVALPRDLWRLDAMTSIAPSIDCYEADVRTMDGRQLARDLRVHTQEQALPVLLLLDPVTSYCERRMVPAMDALGALDGKAIVNELLCFLADHGSPHQYLDQRQPAPHMAADDEQQQQHRNNNDRSSGAAAPFVVEDVDEEGDGRIRHGATGGTTAFTSDGDDNDDGDGDGDVSVEDVSPMSSPNIAIGNTTTTTTANSPLSSTVATAAAAVITPISIDAWRADANATDTSSSSSGSGAYRLRCRLPRSTLDLSLKPTTPLSVLLQYLAYVVYDADRALYTTLPRIALYAGFPPREVVAANAVTAERNNVDGDNDSSGDAVVTRTIAECAGIRSGDVLTVKATKQE